MIRVVSFNYQGNLYPVFIDDTTSGYNGKDVMTKPGVYSETITEGFRLSLAELQGSIDGYATKCMALLADVSPESAVLNNIVDYTDSVKQLLTVPETAAKMLLNRESEDDRLFLQTALDVIHFYESVTPDTKVFLPDEAFEFIEEDVAKRMQSKRHVFVLPNADNQEILQKDCTAQYGVILPSVDDLHSDNDVSPNALDILRVAAPCRREVTPGVYQYSGVYHTPYYKVDPKVHGMIPSYLSHLNGYARNNLLGIQPHERHMYDNLYTFICSDVARYVGEIVTGLFFTTSFGVALKKVLSCKNEELLAKLSSSLNGFCPEGVTCNITYTELQALFSEGYSIDRLNQLAKNSIQVTTEYLHSMIEESTKNYCVVDIRNLPFVLDTSDEDKESFTEQLIAKNVITRDMLDYILALCLRAYAVNWGHTGAARAIPRFVLQPSIQSMNEIMAAYLTQTLGKTAAPMDSDFSLLYTSTSRASDDDDDDDDDDEVFTAFDYYITSDTAYKVRTGSLQPDFFSSAATGAETSEASIVEYWRKVNGDSNLSYFISSSFVVTKSVSVLLESFAKLMRWGDIKPSLLVFQDYPEIRTVFDLNIGKEIPNTAIVDESQLVLVNGCHYSLAGVITAQDIVGAEPAVVGFLLCKDYGVKKYTLASWVDIGEMVSKGEIDIDALKTVTQVPLSGDSVFDITQFENSGYQFYTSAMNIEKGLKFNILPAALNELSLLITPGILRSAEYLKSKQSTMVITTKDRQYQILSTYCSVIRELYSTEAAILKAPELSTADISALSVKAFALFNNEGKKQAPDVNQARAQQTIASLNLSGTPAIEYSDVPLEGKFTVISDMEMQSNFPSLEFSNPQLQQVAHKVRDRIVMLLLETEDSFILCRKDISPTEILIVNTKIDHKKYSQFDPLVKALIAGRPANISLKSGVKKAARLHRSLAEFL